MVTFRKIDRNDIWKRRTEADNCFHFALFHAATLTASSGIELLLELLVYELHEELNHRDTRAAKKLRRQLKEEEDRHKVKNIYWGLGRWIRFYERNDIIGRLERQFNYQFDKFNNYTLSKINDYWNSCKHDPDLATKEIANEIVFYLNDYLEESNFQQIKSYQKQILVDAVGRHWLNQWSQPLMQWLAEHGEDPIAEILYALQSYLDLILTLIDDNRVSYQYKTSLMVAANYVFSDIDLIPESHIEVDGLVDDAAVLVLTLYWLLQQEDFDNSIAFAHWPGGADLSTEVDRLKMYIWTIHEHIFPDARWQMGSKLVWGVIKRIADKGPEALWQNYWKEQYRAEIN